MYDGQVYEDYRSFGDNYDVASQTNRHTVRGIVVSLVLVGGAMALLSFYVGALMLLYLEVLLSMFIMAPIIFYVEGRMNTKMNMASQGYDVDWEPDRQRWFGYDTYRVRRADPGTSQNMIIGFNGNPFATSMRDLQDLESKQRADAVCDECGTEPEFGFDGDGAYFVEQRRRYWLFGVPVRETVLDWETYCVDHRPSTEDAR